MKHRLLASFAAVALASIASAQHVSTASLVTVVASSAWSEAPAGAWASRAAIPAPRTGAGSAWKAVLSDPKAAKALASAKKTPPKRGAVALPRVAASLGSLQLQGPSSVEAPSMVASRDLAANGLTAIPEPRSYAAALGVLSIGGAALGRRWRARGST